jgi:hypothetical protein
MISFSLLLNCRLRSPADALAVLGILPADISSYGDTSPEFLPMQRNGALLSAASGAFTHAADVFLYACDPTKIETELLTISSQGVDIAMPVPQDTDPEVYWYWHMGVRRMLRVVDISGQLELVDPLGRHGLE